MKALIGNIIQANKIFNLIEPHDRIVVGISAGKDSMCLLYALAIYRKKMLSELGQTFEVFGVHVALNIVKGIDYQPIIDFFAKYDVPFEIIDSNIGEVLKSKAKKDGRLECSLCSKMKKAVLAKWAHEHNCNKIAMGHHADDAIETLFMNMINEGRIATFKPKIFLERSQLTFIRPLILAREKTIVAAKKELDVPILTGLCTMTGLTHREQLKPLLQTTFYENPKYKASYKNFYLALLNGKGCELWFIDNDLQKIDEDLRDWANWDPKG